MVGEASLCMYNTIIHIEVEVAFTDFLLKFIVHHSLEGGWGVSQAKEYNCWFKESVACFKGSLPFVSFLDVDVVISPLYIELPVPFFSQEAVDKVRDQGERVFVGNCPFIKISIILYWAVFPILLFDEEEATCIKGLGPPNAL